MLYSLCRNQLRLAPMGEVIGLDYGGVKAVLDLYGEGQEMFEIILFCWDVEQEIEIK